MMTIEIIGLGYVGLPLLKQALKKGLRVIGVDTDDAKRSSMSSELASNINTDQLQFSATPIPADVFFVCVPTPVRRNFEPDLSSVVSAASMFAEVLSVETVN